MTNPFKNMGVGVGLRIPHYSYIFEHNPHVDFFEIISENFMVDGGLPIRNLERILERYRVVQHGVSMNLGSIDPLNFDYLADLKKLADKTGTPYVTDHLCWSGAGGAHHHDLLPMPYTEENARYIAERARIVQDYLGRPLGLENLSSYMSFKNSTMTEWDFYNRVVELSGCYYMLDINNVYVSATNQKFDPKEYIASIDFNKVTQVHIAGHTVNPDGTILDTHDMPVCDAVWELYRMSWEQSENGFSTLLEWDGNFIPFPETVAEAEKAKGYQGVSVG